MVWLTPLSLPHVLCLLVHFHKAARFSGIKKEIRALSSLPNTPVPRITGSEVKCQHLTIVSGTLCGLRFAFLTLTPLPIVFSPPHYPEIHGLLMFPEDNVKLFPMIESLSPVPSPKNLLLLLVPSHPPGLPSLMVPPFLMAIFLTCNQLTLFLTHLTSLFSMRT